MSVVLYSSTSEDLDLHVAIFEILEGHYDENLTEYSELFSRTWEFVEISVLEKNPWTTVFISENTWVSQKRLNISEESPAIRAFEVEIG